MADFIYGIWFVGDGHSQDYFAKLLKRDGKWTLEYRFRYYDKNDGDPHEGKDRKSHYIAKMDDDSPASLIKALVCINTVIVSLEHRYGQKHDFVDLQCREDDPKVMFELGSRPWAHIKLLPQGSQP